MKELEDAIVARLKEKITDLNSDASPEKPEDYMDTPGTLAPDGGILVGYQKTKFNGFTKKGSSDQDKTPVLGIFLFAKDKETSYAYLKKIRDGLNGYQFNNTGEPLECIDESFLFRTETFWVWAQLYQVNLLNEEF